MNGKLKLLHRDYKKESHFKITPSCMLKRKDKDTVTNSGRMSPSCTKIVPPLVSFMPSSLSDHSLLILSENQLPAIYCFGLKYQPLLKGKSSWYRLYAMSFSIINCSVW